MAFQKLVDAAALGETLLEGYNVKNITGLSFSGTTVTLSWTDANDASQTTTYEVEARFTSALATKLAAIEDNAKDDQTATEIKDSLETLSGNDRLDASAVKDLPEGTVASDATLTGEGTSDDPLKVTNPFTSAYETKLDGIAAGAEVNVNADWDATSGDAQILNKPTLPTPRTDGEIDARIATEARAGNNARWPVSKVPTLANLGGLTQSQVDGRIATEAQTGNTGRWGSSKLPADVVYTNTQRFTTALLAKLNALPSASSIQFENHPISSAGDLNALSRTTDSLDFVTITAAISSGITANTVVDGSGNALTSLASGDLLILGHDDNRWVRVVNLPTTAVVDQATVRGFIDGDFVEGLLARLSGASRLSYTSLKDTPTIPAAQVQTDWDATTGLGVLLNKPTIPGNTDIDARIATEARAGNNGRWPLAKLPYSSRTADGIVSAAQAIRIDDSIDSAHLHSTPSINAAQLQSGDAFLLDDASVDNDSGSQLKEIDVSDLDTRWAVKPDWNAAAGNKAEVLNKPAAATQAEAEAGTETGTRLWSPSRVSQAIARLAPTAGSGGTATPAELFVIAARPAADVAITRASSERHVWSPFSTIESTAPVAASQAGNVLIIADVHVTVNRSETSDARTEYRLVRTRSSTDETLITEIAGGPSNVSSTDAPWRDATKRDGGAISWHDVAQENDVYKLEARVISNDGTNDRTYTFDRENNGLAVFGVTGGGLGQTQVDARITALRPNEFTSADETKLDGIAAGAEVNVKADWTETDTGSDAFIRNKPTLATVATSGSYDDLGNKPSIPDNAAIDARIDVPARAGNTGRWAKAKLPADTIYTGNQRFSSADETKLDGIENNAKDDQSATEIRDALAGLSGNARLAARAIRDLPTLRSFIVNVRPASTVSQTTRAANTYVAYEMLMTAPAITAAQAGNVEIKVHIHADVTTVTSGGGERVVTKARLRRTRGSATDTTQDEFHFYGPRNVSNVDSADADFYFAYAVDAQEGDVFFVEVQTASQVGGRTTEFNTTQNLMQITPI